MSGIPPISTSHRPGDPFKHGNVKLAMEDFAKNFFTEPSNVNSGMLAGKMEFLAVFAHAAGGQVESDFKNSVLPAYKEYIENPSDATQNTLTDALTQLADDTPLEVPNLNQAIVKSLNLIESSVNDGGNTNALEGLTYAVDGMMKDCNQYSDEAVSIANDMFNQARNLDLGVGNAGNEKQAILTDVGALLGLIS